MRKEIDEMNEKELIQLARQAICEHKDQLALDCYLKVNKENETNAEAAYWTYTAYWQNCIDNNESYENKYMAFTALSNELVTAVAEIAGSEGDETIKDLVLFTFACVYLPIADYAVKNAIAAPKDRIEKAALTCYWTGNAIERNFGSKPDFMKTACKLWKEGVKLQRQFYAYTYNDNKAEDYAEKIKKVEPDYEMPKKAGCISLSK